MGDPGPGALSDQRSRHTKQELPRGAPFAARPGATAVFSPVPSNRPWTIVKGVWIAGSQQWRMHAVIHRLGDPGASGPTPHWVGPVQVQAQARHRGVAGDLGFYVYAVAEP
jgi:hypothetical protein